MAKNKNDDVFHKTSLVETHFELVTGLIFL